MEASDYIIIADSEKSEVQLQVKRLISEGWKLLGGIKYADMLFVQSLYKD